MRSFRSPTLHRRAALLGAVAAVFVGVGAVAVLPAAHAVSSEPIRIGYVLPRDLPSRHARAPDPPRPALLAMESRDSARDRAALTTTRGHRLPYLARSTGAGRPTLVITARGATYDLATVAHLVPAAFTRLAGGALLLEDPIVVAPRASLVIDSDTTSGLFLSSGATGYTTISAVRSTLTLLGHPGRPLTVTSYDPVTHVADTDRHDGRAYVLTRGGQLNLHHVTASDLGFASSGETSGVAWTSAGGHPATGGASDSGFVRNYFGAYAMGAKGLAITRSSFVDNTIYGFDPHTATKDTVVTASVAALNGRHGFMFSEGCDGNVVRGSTALLNGGAGFMIDDGTPAHGRGRPSNDNTFVDDSSHDNGDAGFVVEGGTGNAVEHSDAADNDYGIWVRNHAAGTLIVDDHVSSSLLVGVRLGPGLGPTEVTDVVIIGAAIGLDSEGGSATTMTSDRVSDTTEVGLRLEGDQGRAHFTAVALTRSAGLSLDVRGTPLSARALAGIEGRAIGHMAWTLLGVLHLGVILLWSSILVLPLLSRIPMVRQKLRRLVPGTDDGTGDGAGVDARPT